MAELTPEGLDAATQAEILADIEADQRAEISSALDLSTSSPLGQLNRLLSRAIRIQEEALAAVYLAIDPDSNTGDAQFRIGALTGTIREPATASRVAVLCTLGVGTYAIGDLTAAPTGRPEDRFSNVAEVIVGVGGNVSVVFEADDTGPIQAAEDTLAIASPVAGWTAIVSHPDATPGDAIETEAAFRLRRNSEVEAPGSSSAAGIAADLTQNLPLIETATVVSNDTDAVVDSIPAHAIEAIVFGPVVPSTDDDDAVAEQILASKAAGIATYGTTSRTVLDTQGVSHVVSFTRPADVTVPITVTLVVDSETYAGDSEVAAVVALAAADLLPGRDVSWSNVTDWIMGVAGVLRITAITVNAVSFGTRTITSRQRASILASDVTITSAEGTP